MWHFCHALRVLRADCCTGTGPTAIIGVLQSVALMQHHVCLRVQCLFDVLAFTKNFLAAQVFALDSVLKYSFRMQLWHRRSVRPVQVSDCVSDGGSVVLRKTAASVAIVVLLTTATVFAYGLANSAARPDCAGKVECPLTGELVCRDQCPLIDADREDCPGKIECPLTDELVCKDRCPLDETADAGGGCYRQ